MTSDNKLTGDEVKDRSDWDAEVDRLIRDVTTVINDVTIAAAVAIHQRVGCNTAFHPLSTLHRHTDRQIQRQTDRQIDR